jgi:cytochrome c oxidase subunit II
VVENRDPAVRLERSFWIVTAILAVLSIAGIYYWIIAPLTSWLPEAVIPADQIDKLFRFLAASSTALFIFVIGYLLYFTIKFRLRRSDSPDAIGVQIHDSNVLETWWTIVPTIFIIILAIFSVKIWYEIQVQPSTGLTVESIGHQWFYTFRYPNVHGEIPNEMHLPLNVPVTLHVTSTDVIHSFWVPAMRLKADMVPGSINTLRFTPLNAGRYPIICTEFCGTEHGTMNKQIVVVEPKEKFFAWYVAWQKKNKNVSDALPSPSATGAIQLAAGDPGAGKAIFSTKCTSCHAIGPFNQKIVGPGLKGILTDPAHPNLVDGDKATPANIAKILQQGYKGDMGTMPNQQLNGLSAKDIADLVAFLKSLK